MKCIGMISAATVALLFFAESTLAATAQSGSNVPAKSAYSNSAEAENSLSAGTFGLTVSTSSNAMITGKFFTQNDLALLGGFGLVNTSGAGTDIYLMAGIRKYIKTDKQSANFVPFVGGRLWHSTVNSVGTNGWGLSAEGGAEYFLSRHFSLEGLVSAGYGSNTPSGGSATSTLSTTVYSLGANLYF